MSRDEALAHVGKLVLLHGHARRPYPVRLLEVALDTASVEDRSFGMRDTLRVSLERIEALAEGGETP